MKTLNLPLVGGAMALLICAAPFAAAHAQPADRAGADASALVTEHGDWTLKQRENWLYSRLDKARDDGAIDGQEQRRVRGDLSSIRDDERRMREHHDGQLTDNETAELEARLDGVASQIHWLHEDAFKRPW
jgi:phosphoglycerate-specific signal transduction histidine kinase